MTTFGTVWRSYGTTWPHMGWHHSGNPAGGVPGTRTLWHHSARLCQRLSHCCAWGTFGCSLSYLIAHDNLLQRLDHSGGRMAPHGAGAVVPLGDSGWWSARDAKPVAPLCQTVQKVGILCRLGYFWLLSFVFDRKCRPFAQSGGRMAPRGPTWGGSCGTTRRLRPSECQGREPCGTTLPGCAKGCHTVAPRVLLGALFRI